MPFVYLGGITLSIDQASAQDLQAQLADLEKQYNAFEAANLSLDLTRGKPNSAQLDLSNLWMAF